MTRLRVWAPNAARLELALGDERRPMTREDGGWWGGEWPDIGAGTDYAFSIDGGPPLPDPRTRWQPHGVHGTSRVVDPDAYQWADDGWKPPALSDAVVYELHVGTFSPAGTFDGAIEHLPALAHLGITHVEVMPVNAFPGARGWGYDGVALFAPHEPYGGPEGFKRFVNACHGHGLAVILDVVYNHFGPDGNYLPQFGPYLTDRYVTPWGDAVNLDGPGSDEVRRFFIDNACQWLDEYHVDGLRLDAVHAFVDLSAVHFLEELAAEVRALSGRLRRQKVLIAESDLNDPRLLRPVDQGGYGLDAAWSDDFHHAVHVALTGERDGYYGDFDGLPDIVRALERIYVYDWRYSPARDRRHGRPADGLAPDRFVVFAQNHDQVGNRAAGQRLAHLVTPDALRVAATLVLAGPFVPLLFQGEEWAASSPFLYFTDHVDRDLGAAVTEGRRREFAAFGWAPDAVPDPQDPGTFRRSILDRTEQDRSPHREILEWHRRLVQLRRTLPGLRDGRRPAVRWDPVESWLTQERDGVLVAVHLGPERAVIPCPEGDDWTVALASSEGIGISAGRLVMPSMSSAILARGRSDETG
jgi:maltooligosyltrehalose trehalohydrolase